ncbi:MAG: hypothetical protein C5B48_13320 [Candidatus Rokuibacteriota bacterium]|nr:MAG: hypothetical protein C5B48_13320 [Candidatus Rokubacteria bacterium]
MTALSEEQSCREFEALLEGLRRQGLDLTGYREGMLRRRIAGRMGQVNVELFGDYLHYVETHPDEVRDLFNAVQINVTSFFRDSDPWNTLYGDIIPAIVSSKRHNEPIRVWSAGCASGEEAFSLAMLWAESLGVEESSRRVKIYATDVDEDALSNARRCTYDARTLEAVPVGLRHRYFEPTRERYTVRRDVRRMVIFGRHDLMHDAPLSRLDLLVCRNTLIYLSTAIQSRILAWFRFALNDHGYLFVGRAEMLRPHNGLFSPAGFGPSFYAKASRTSHATALWYPARRGVAYSVGGDR